MTSDVENISHWLAVAAFVIAGIGIAVLLLGISSLLGSRSKGRYKHEPFESGLPSVGTARLRFHFKFYLVAIAFLIFEAEAAYLYAYAVSVREVGWHGFIGATIFTIILLVGLVYEFRIGAVSGDANKRKPELSR